MSKKKPFIATVFDKAQSPEDAYIEKLEAERDKLHAENNRLVEDYSKRDEQVSKLYGVTADLRAELSKAREAMIVSPDGAAHLCLPAVRELYYDLRAELAAALKRVEELETGEWVYVGNGFKICPWCAAEWQAHTKASRNTPLTA